MTTQEVIEGLSSLRGRLALYSGTDNDHAVLTQAMRELSGISGGGVPIPMPGIPLPTPAKRQRVFLGIGTNYVGTPNQLGGCLNDVAKWGSLFRSRGFTPKLILGKHATRAAILSEFRNLAAQPDADLIFQFSGHGTHFRDRNGDETDGQDEAIVPDDVSSKGVISDDELREICDSVAPGSRLLVIMDCCHSGSNTRTLFGGCQPRGIAWPDGVALPPRVRHRSRGEQQHVSFGACLDRETAGDTGTDGVFSLSAVNAFADGGTFRDWLERAAVKIRGQQTPVYTGPDWDINDFFGSV